MCLDINPPTSSRVSARIREKAASLGTLRARTRKHDSLRATSTVVNHRQKCLPTPRCLRRERDADSTARTSGETRTTCGALHKKVAEVHASNSYARNV